MYSPVYIIYKYTKREIEPSAEMRGGSVWWGVQGVAARERKSWIYMHRLFIFYFKSCLHIDGMLNIQHTALHKFISLHQILPLMHINDFIIKPFQCIIYFGWLTHTHSLWHRAQRRRRHHPAWNIFIVLPTFAFFSSLTFLSLICLFLFWQG